MSVRGSHGFFIKLPVRPTLLFTTYLRDVTPLAMCSDDRYWGRSWICIAILVDHLFVTFFAFFIPVLVVHLITSMLLVLLGIIISCGIHSIVRLVTVLVHLTVSIVALTVVWVVCLSRLFNVPA